MATTYNIWTFGKLPLVHCKREPSNSVDRYAVAVIKSDIVRWLLRWQTMARTMIAVHQDQGAPGDVARLLNSVVTPTPTRLHVDAKCFHWVAKSVKISTVKFSPAEAKGEIGENFPPAKISRYTVNNKVIH